MMGWTRDTQLIGGRDCNWWVKLSEHAQTLFQSRRKKLGGVIKKAVRTDIDWPSDVSSDDRVDALNPQRVHSVCRAMESAMHDEP